MLLLSDLFALVFAAEEILGHIGDAQRIHLEVLARHEQAGEPIDDDAFVDLAAHVLKLLLGGSAQIVIHVVHIGLIGILLLLLPGQRENLLLLLVPQLAGELVLHEVDGLIVVELIEDGDRLKDKRLVAHVQGWHGCDREDLVDKVSSLAFITILEVKFVGDFFSAVLRHIEEIVKSIVLLKPEEILHLFNSVLLHKVLIHGVHEALHSLGKIDFP